MADDDFEARVDEETADESAFIDYMTKLHRLEQDGERTTLTMGPWSAMVIVGFIQLAMRHPDTGDPLVAVGRDFVEQLMPLFKGTLGEEIIRRGNHA